ncbi:MAG: hypothetical protein U0Z44_13260 [Kouleothrix sp.]
MAAPPGLINTHAHAGDAARGAAEDVPVEAWFNEYIWSMETDLTPEDVYWGAMLAAAGADRERRDHSGRPPLRDRLGRRGDRAERMRAHLAPTLFGQGAARRARPGRGVAAAGMRPVWSAPGWGRTRYTCARPSSCARWRRKLRCSAWAATFTYRRQPSRCRPAAKAPWTTPIRLLAQLGMLDTPLLCAESRAHATPEIGLLAAHGAGVAHCPKTFAGCRHRTPIEAMRARA